jgi:soluble lytic murein transglycosylase-like protein
MVEKYAQLHGVDKALVNAVIRQESGFNPAAVSKAGAQGLMQLMPGTAKGLGVENSLNPEQNIDGGVRLLKSLLKTYNGNIPLALAAYNAGGGAVAKYGGIPPYKETQNYVRSILSSYLATKQSNGVA